MENINYTNMANELLGDELYYKFTKEVAKDYKGCNLIDFGSKVIDKCWFLIIMIGFSKKIKLDSSKICLEDEIIEIKCKEFAEKYEQYAKKIEENMFETIKY